ncbi:MAG: hypothetical protein M1823_003951 [Watsoniomyces obsoletus]|nr:MAG: hypothetical protein M1823_003951 [Watsoniomyces obsoletus]
MDTYDPKTAHPSLALHVADPNGIPLLSSASLSSTGNSSQLKALTELTTTCLNAQEIAARFGLGSLQRVSIETANGANVMQRRLEPPTVGGDDLQDGKQDEVERPERDAKQHGTANGNGNVSTQAEQGPPVLVRTVVVPSEADLAEGRQAGEELDVVASSFQQAWLDEMAGEDNNEGMNGYGEQEE